MKSSKEDEDTACQQEEVEERKMQLTFRQEKHAQL